MYLIFGGLPLQESSSVEIFASANVLIRGQKRLQKLVFTPVI